MLESIEKLLVLQDRDRKISHLRQELEALGPQRSMGRSRLQRAEEGLNGARLRSRQTESERKRVELEVEAKKQQIEKYSLQQFQTKKNEEYRALAHEISMAKSAIVKLEDQELELMEQGEAAVRDVTAAQRAHEEAHREVERQITEIDARERNLKMELSRLEAERAVLAGEADSDALNRYERLRRTKGERVVVGIAHGVCGGCHMKLPAQILISCQTSQELVPCSNCGRILYYTRDMSLVPTE
jgi:predicted  nucleic acid-binding Zn-ribbon protein